MVMTGLILIVESPTLREPSRASLGVFSSGLIHALHHYSHAVGLDNRNWCLRGDEFPFGDYIDDVIGKQRFTAGS